MTRETSTEPVVPSDIRPAEDADRAAIAAVQAASWRGAYADQLPDAYIRDGLDHDLTAHWQRLTIEEGDVVLVCEADGELIGFIAVWCRPEPFIDNLHVRPERRSSGLGERLMRAAASRLVAQGTRTAYLWVVAANTGAIRFYERLGGTRREAADKDLFGHPAPHLRIAWDDLRVLAGT